MAEEDFFDFYYMVLVPADPDFGPLVELSTGLPIGYIKPGTLEKNYPRPSGPLSKRPLDSPQATAMFAQLLQEISPRADPDLLIHSRRGSQNRPRQEEAQERRSYSFSPDGKRLLVHAPQRYWGTALLDAQTGETLFTGTIHGFSPTGRYFTTDHSRTAYGIRRSDDCELVLELERGRLPPPFNPTNIHFTPDDARVFFAIHQEDGSILRVFDLPSGRQIVEHHLEMRYFRIRATYSGSTFVLTYKIRDPGLYLFNWRTAEYVHHFDEDCSLLRGRLIQVSSDDKTVAYVRSKPSPQGDIAPDVFTLCIEELPTRRVLKSVELPCEPKELRFVLGERAVMTTGQVRAWDYRRNVAVLYGVKSDERDGETISWTPAGWE